MRRISPQLRISWVSLPGNGRREMSGMTSRTNPTSTAHIGSIATISKSTSTASRLSNL
jgi:hypothetical protein